MTFIHTIKIQEFVLPILGFFLIGCKINIVKQIKNLLFILWATLLGIFFVACGKEKTIFEKSYDIKNQQWSYTDTLDFTFDIADTMSIYDIVLNINHTPQYPMQNIYMNIYTQFPSGERIKQLLNIDLADNTGKWEGKCSGSECLFEIPIQSNAFFNATGKHNITLEQYMRVENLAGVNNIALKIVDKGEKRDLSADAVKKK